MVRLWERALRRTDIPCAYSEGFNPRQKLSFGPPLSLGISSECELLDIFLEKWTSPDSVKNELNKVLPKGIEIIEATNIFSGMAALTASLRFAEYTAMIDTDISDRIKEILNSNEIVFQRKEKQINVRPLIKDISINGNKLVLVVQCDGKGTLRGDEISKLFSGAALKSVKRTSLI